MLRLSVLLGLSACSEYAVRDQPKGDPPPANTEEPEEEEGEPIADAGANQERQPLQDVSLDATDSHDPDGLELVAAKWTLVDKPSGSTASLDRDDAWKPTFWADLAGEYAFELTVQNEDGVWDSTPDDVVVNVLPLDGFYVELSWNEGNDLDLHLMDASANLFSDGDCSYCNMTPPWGDPGAADDPSLDWDAIYGFGPEVITIDAPSDGSFYVAVHYYGENGAPSCIQPCPVSEATISIYMGGVLAETYTQTLSDQGNLWQVARIDWPSTQIEELGTVGHTAKTYCGE